MAGTLLTGHTVLRKLASWDPATNLSATVFLLIEVVICFSWRQLLVEKGVLDASLGKKTYVARGQDVFPYLACLAVVCAEPLSFNCFYAEHKSSSSTHQIQSTAQPSLAVPQVLFRSGGRLGGTWSTVCTLCSFYDFKVGCEILRIRKFMRRSGWKI